MAQADGIISNASGAAVRADLNNQLAALFTNHSGATEPSTTYAYQWWADTTAGQLKIRNGSNDGWIVLQELDGTLLMEDGTVGAPGLAFASDLDSGFYRIGANQLGIATNGTNAIAIDGSQQLGVGISTGLGGLLHVQDTLEATANNNYSLVINGNDGGTDGESASIFLGALNVTTRGTSIAAERQSGSNDHDLIFSTSAASAAPSERVRIDSSGNVGINTASSTELLSVNGNIWLGNGGGSGGAEMLRIWNDSGVERIHASNNPSALAFGIGGSAGTNEAFRVDGGKRLLVGATSIIGGSTDKIQALSSITLYDATSSIAGAGQRVNFRTDGGAVGATKGYISGENDSTYSYAGRLVFATTDSSATTTERMRIKSNGFTELAPDGVFLTSTSHVIRSSTDHDTLYVRNSNASFSNYILRVAASRNTSDGSYSFINCVREGAANVFFVRDSGNVENINNSYGAISDLKLKENIVDASSQWDDLKAIQVRNYNFKEGQTHTQIGLIAQEVELVSPGLVSEAPDRDEEGNDLGTVTKSVNYSVLYMKAVKALQEAMERIETLEQRLSDAGIA